MREVPHDSPGLIGVPCGDLGRYVRLYDALDKLIVPQGSELRFATGANVAHNCNALVKELLTKPDFEWLWIMGDDHGFSEDVLLKLLARQVDIVVPIVSRRGAPFQTVLYKVAALDASTYLTYSWGDLTRDYPAGGLIQVDAAGSAGMLIRRHVFSLIEDPWFEWTRRISEDVNFCLKARKAGISINADLEQILTHITPAELTPYRNKAGEWNVAANSGGRSVSLTNTPHGGKDLREITYGHKDGVGGAEWSAPPEPDAQYKAA